MTWRLILLYRRVVWPWYLGLIVVIISCLVSWRDFSRLIHTSSSYTVWEAILSTLAGPRPDDYSLLSALPWLVTNLYFLFHVNRSYSNAPSFLNEQVMLRAGSRTVWSVTQVWLLIIVTAAYCVLLYIGVTLSMIVFHIAYKPSELITFDVDAVMILLPIFLLFYGTLLVMATLQFFLVLLLKHPIHGFIISVILYCTAWLVQDYVILSILPPAQAMIFRHSSYEGQQTHFTLEWSLIYSACLLFIVVTTLIFYARHMDITHD
jgi:hypothetical protein